MANRNKKKNWRKRVLVPDSRQLPGNDEKRDAGYAEVLKNK